MRKTQKFLIFIVAILCAKNSFAVPSFKQSRSSGIASVLKADQIDADKEANVMVAKGNAE